MVEANPTNQVPQQQPATEEMSAPQEQQFATPGSMDQQNLDMGVKMSAAAPMMHAPPAFNAIKMKGLPFSVTRDEIIQFFTGQGHNINVDSLKIGMMADGKLTGEACVLFETSQECTDAQAALDQKHIGTRWVKLIRVSMDEYNGFERE